MASGVTTITGRARAPRVEVAAVGRKVPKRPLGRRIGRSVFALSVVVVFMAPYLWILSSSFKNQTAIFADVSPLSIWTFLPRNPTLANYSSALTSENVARALLNSVIIACAQVLCTFILAVPAAYALSRLRFRGQGVIFSIIFLTFMVPGEAIIVPLFQIVSHIGLANTLPGVFLPWIASPFALFLLRQAFLEIPDELDQAAKIDGAGHLRIMLNVIVPNVKPAMAAMALVVFLFSWNAFLWPLIIIQSQQNEVVQVAIAINTVPGELPNWGQVFAGAVLATLPVLTLFAFLQRYFVRGITLTGLKG
jgi:ABC-type glycerol-3-phosphate transport system permease component